ncbi:MAG: hypothetical protein JW384_02137 [Nitrosomonadaceae bacterium]|nr:hypothetical protein [Nitrosomonadaceae bacterium]
MFRTRKYLAVVVALAIPFVFSSCSSELISDEDIEQFESELDDLIDELDDVKDEFDDALDESRQDCLDSGLLPPADC